MPRPLIPPKGCFIPSHITFHPSLPPAVIHTYSQLRSLAWGRTATPPLRMYELARLTHKSEATLYRHMALLKHYHLLRWRLAEPARLIYTFPTDLSGSSNRPLTSGAHRPEMPAPTLKAAAIPNFNNDDQADGDPGIPNFETGDLEYGDAAIPKIENDGSVDDNPTIRTIESDDQPGGASPIPNCENGPAFDSQKRESQPQFHSQKCDSAIPNFESQPSVESLINHDSSDCLISESLILDNLNTTPRVNPLESDSEFKEKNISYQVTSEGVGEYEGEREIIKNGVSFADLPVTPLETSPGLESEAAPPGSPSPESVYRELTGISPDPLRIDKLLRMVTDLEVWRESVGHWLEHGWNPDHIAGILEVYKRGGPSGCFICSHPDPPRRRRLTLPPESDGHAAP